MEQTTELDNTKEFHAKLLSLVDEYMPKVPIEVLARIVTQVQLDLVFCYSDSRVAAIGKRITQEAEKLRASQVA